MERTIWAQAFKTYLQSLKKSPHTIKQYIIDAEQFMAHAGNKQVDETLLQMYEKMLKNTYSSTNSINRKLASSRQFLLYLHSRGLVDAGLAERLQPVPKEKKTLDVSTHMQVQAVRAVWPRARLAAETEEHAWLALRNGLIIELIASLGLKPAEIIQLEWSQLDLEQRLLQLRQGKEARALKLSASLVEAFHYYAEETRKFMPIAEDVPYIWLGIGNQQGKAISVKTIERIFQFVSKSVGFKVTATNLRYAAIGREQKRAGDEAELYKQFGYARKGVLQERQDRMK